MVERVKANAVNSDCSSAADEIIINSSPVVFPDKDIRNPDLLFKEKGHKYIYRDKELVSVTTWLSQFFVKFDIKDQAAKSQLNPNSEYYDAPIAEIMASWRSKAANGTLVHAEIEEYLLSRKEPLDIKALRAIEYVDEVAKRFNLKESESFPEVRICSAKLGLAGTVDWIVKTPYGLILYDWKTSKSLYYDREKYYAQLNVYAYILEKIYGFPVVGMRLVHLKKHTYVVHIVEKDFDTIERFLSVNNSL